MMNEEIVQRIQATYSRGEELIKFIEKELPALQKAAILKQQESLTKAILERNQQLKKELEFWQKRVIDLELANGIVQHALPSKSSSTTFKPVLCASSAVPPQPSAAPVKAAEKKTPIDAEKKTPIDAEKKTPIDAEKKTPIDAEKKTPIDAEKKIPIETEKKTQTKKEKNVKPPKQEPAEESKVDVSRLDLRIGRILNAKRHPDAENLYVEEIDVAEDKPRTVVSGLVRFVPLEAMQDRLVVVLCNLKPVKMRGIASEAMVMCASTPDKVEILEPPSGCIPGDRVVCDEFPGQPDSLLNPKKKIFEQVAPDLKTDGDCNATYKLAPLKIAGKGVVRTASLVNVQIK